MDFLLDERQKLVRTQIIEFCRKELGEGIQERDRSRTFANDLWLKCGQMDAFSASTC